MSTIIITPPGLEGVYGTGTTPLREIEQEVARRVGPYLLHVVTARQEGEPSGTISTTTSIPIGAMRSTLDLGGMEDRYILRRGRLSDGTRLPLHDEYRNFPFTAEDRVRLIRTYSPGSGIVEVDREYAHPCYDDEEIEIHHLDPHYELRPAVLAGLRRCWLVHRLQVSSGLDPLGRFDLSAFAPWITTRDQVYDVTFESGAPMVNWRVDGYHGGVSLRIGEWSPATVVVVNRRSVASMVRPNPWPPGGTSEDIPVLTPILTAPIVVGGEDPEGWEYRTGNVNEFWSDEDELQVPLDYAAAAGHIECWRTARPRMSLVAQTGMWADQKEVAAEFTRVVTVYFDKPRHQVMLPFWGGSWAGGRSNNLTNAGF